MNEITGSYFVCNGRLKTADEFDGTILTSGSSVYEVMRTVDGIPFFFRDHCLRLEGSLKSKGRSAEPGFAFLRTAIMLLASAEKHKAVNLKIVSSLKEGREEWIVYYTKTSYPSDDEYLKGVKAELLYAEREDPAAKYVNPSLKLKASDLIEKTGAYEVLLVNRHNRITEGSRSNVIFSNKGQLYTAPDIEVLSGITRKHLLEICFREGIKVNLESPDAAGIGDFEHAAMTGTSPVVLPFNEISGTRYDTSAPLFRFLREEYFKLAYKSMNEF